MRAILLSALSLSVVFLVSCNSSSNSPQPPPAPNKSITQETLDIGVCDLLKEPETYERKLVRLKGILCDCSEDGRLYSSKCADGKKIWVQGEFGTCKNADRIDKFRSASKNDGERMWGSWHFGVIAEGRLTGSKGGYGHMNGYDYLFEIDCFQHAERLDEKSNKPEDLRRRMEEFEK